MPITVSPHRSVKRQALSLLLFGFFSVLSLIILTPFLSMILTSFKDSSRLITHGFNLSLEPQVLTLENYKILFQGDSDYFTWYGNSLLLTTLQTALTLFVSAWVAYGFAFYTFRGKSLLFVCVLIVMMIPFEILMLPMYQEITAMKLSDSFIGIMLPYLAQATAIFFFRQFLSFVPYEIVNAGRVDGCSEYGIFLKLVLPNMTPAFAAMAILIGMNTWNNYLWPLLVLRSSRKFTLPVGLNSLLSPYGNNYQLLVSGAVMSILPIMLLFFCAQKYFIEGISTGSIKG